MAKKKSVWDAGYYEQYDTSEGFGNAGVWNRLFQARMGFDEATRVLKDENPYTVLELLPGVSWDDVKSAYRKMAMRYHPDRNPGDKDAAAMFLKVQAAYEVLEETIKPRS